MNSLKLTTVYFYNVTIQSLIPEFSLEIFQRNIEINENKTDEFLSSRFSLHYWNFILPTSHDSIFKVNTLKILCTVEWGEWWLSLFGHFPSLINHDYLPIRVIWKVIIVSHWGNIHTTKKNIEMFLECFKEFWKKLLRNCEKCWYFSTAPKKPKPKLHQTRLT